MKNKLPFKVLIFITIISGAVLFLSATLVKDETTVHKVDQEKIDNLVAFAKAYGYVKYFHPSDEASNIDWNRFAAYGAEQVSECGNNSELISTLNKLFKPIAPSIVFSDALMDFDRQLITPENPDDYKPIYWQHRGVSTGMNNSGGDTYRSIRVNKNSIIDESSSFGNLMTSVDPDKYIGKEIKLSGWAKLEPNSKGTGHFWLRVDKEDKTRCFFDNMDADPIKSAEWKHYEIIGEVCDLSSKIVLGSFLKGNGTLVIDDVMLSFKEGAEWVEIPIKNSDFESGSIERKSDQSAWFGKGDGYSFKVSKSDEKERKSVGVIEHVGKLKTLGGDALFESFPKFGELIEKEIGSNIFCQIPLNLFGNEENTFPKSDLLEQLQEKLKGIDESPSTLPSRLGNVINAYNVFQHFYPYFDVVDVNWERELEKALERSFNDQKVNDHVTTLEKFTAPLRDGHIWVSGGNRGRFAPAIHWEWIEDKLIITKVKDEKLNLQVGDEVTSIDNLPIDEYFTEIISRISAGTEGWLKYRGLSTALLGEKDSEIKVEVNGVLRSLKREKKYSSKGSKPSIQENDHKLLDNGIYYLNLNSVEMDTITELMPELEESKGIICDLRGYPNGNHDFISHLLSEKDTSTAWMRIPEFIYPDQEKIVGYDNHGWEMEPKKPYLGDKKIVFLTEGRSISYAESYMSFIEGYKLATIIGQPTAGTNGNVNPFNLLGNIRLSWTGMKVVKHDGSQHHAIGVLPDIYVNKTIEGLKQGKDEYFEKAIEVILE